MAARPACVVDALSTLDRRRELILGWEATAAMAEEVAALHPSLPEVRVNLGWEAGQMQGVLLHIGNAWEADKSVKDVRDVYPLLAELRQRGFKPAGHFDYAEVGRRTYTYRRDDGATISVSVFTFRPGDDDQVDGPSCRFVKVGVEERPVYKLMCDEEGAPEP